MTGSKNGGLEGDLIDGWRFKDGLLYEWDEWPAKGLTSPSCDLCNPFINVVILQLSLMEAANCQCEKRKNGAGYKS